MPAVILIVAVEVEHVHQIADRRRVARHVRIVAARDRVGQVVAAPRGDRTDLPVGLDELENLIASQPKMAPFRSVFMAWAARYVSWQELGPRIAALYANSFTKPELEDLIHFYETPTGRKAAQVMPDLSKQAMLVGASIAREHTPELQQMIRARAAQLKAAAPQRASQSPAPQ